MPGYLPTFKVRLTRRWRFGCTEWTVLYVNVLVCPFKLWFGVSLERRWRGAP